MWLDDVLQQMETTEFLITTVRQTFLDIIDSRLNQQLSPEEVGRGLKSVSFVLFFLSSNASFPLVRGEFVYSNG